MDERNSHKHLHHQRSKAVPAHEYIGANNIIHSHGRSFSHNTTILENTVRSYSRRLEKNRIYTHGISQNSKHRVNDDNDFIRLSAQEL